MVGFSVWAALSACMRANQLLSQGADSCRRDRLLFHHLLLNSSQLAGGGESWRSLSTGSCSLGESLHHCGTLTHTHMHKSNTQPVSSVSFYLSRCHYSLQLSPWPSFGDLMHIHVNTHTHTHSSNPNVPSIFVITRSPDGTRPIGFFI